MGSVSADLAHRVQVASDPCRAFPEADKQGAFFQVRDDAYLALLEFRNLTPEIVPALAPLKGPNESPDSVSKRQARNYESPFGRGTPAFPATKDASGD